MNNGPLLFFGIFLTIAFSWSGIVLTNLVQQTDVGATRPHFDATMGTVGPTPPSGEARQGARVYQDLGCFFCHTQQVRREGFGSDIARAWGERQSVSRDYIYDERVMLGTMRTGPDLRNIGARQTDRNWHYVHLFNPRITSERADGSYSVMPQYPFLFEQRKIVGERSTEALVLPAAYAPPDGYEIVPTPRAQALVAYLLSLRTDYTPPEAMGGGE